MTVYRRWPAKNELLLTAVMMEFRRLFADVYEEARHLNSFDDKRFHRHPLVHSRPIR